MENFPCKNDDFPLKNGRLFCNSRYLLRLPNKTVVRPQISPEMRPQQIELPVGTTLCLRLGGGALGVKVFELDGVDGTTPSLRLVTDEIGLGLNAVRLVGYHYNHSGTRLLNVTRNGLHARFGAIAIAGAAADSVALAALCDRVVATQVDSNVSTAELWSVTATPTVLSTTEDEQLTSVSLSIGRDLSCSNGGVRNQSVHTSWNCLTYRKVNGKETVPQPLRVNGKPVATMPPL